MMHVTQLYQLSYWSFREIDEITVLAVNTLVLVSSYADTDSAMEV
jgi:hypothetical protein